MSIGSLLLPAIAAGVVLALVSATFLRRRDGIAADTLSASLLAHAEAEPARFDPAMLAGLPQAAQRYLLKAIGPGTPLHRVAALTMAGDFVLNGRPLDMRARQVLAPPHGFVWIARIGTGAVRFAGSDAWRAGGTSWTRFWLLRLVPLVRTGGTGDHERASVARMLVETVWTPAALLPRYGALWRELSPHAAEVRLAGFPDAEPVVLTIDDTGNPVAAQTRRWTDANLQGIHRLQPFGGRFTAFVRRQGFLVPSAVEVANMFSTAQESVFFRAEVTGVRFGP